MMDIEKLKQQLDDGVQKLTEEHGQKFAEQTAAAYLEAMNQADNALMENIVAALLNCPQDDFYRLWYPIVDLCMIKNYQVYSHVERSLSFIDGVLRRSQGDGQGDE